MTVDSNTICQHDDPAIGSEWCDWECPIMRMTGEHPTSEDFEEESDDI